MRWRRVEIRELVFKQDQTPKPTQITQQPTIISQLQPTNDGQQNQQQQEMLNLLERILTKMDGFENRLQKVETQNKENFEKWNKSLNNDLNKC